MMVSLTSLQLQQLLLLVGRGLGAVAGHAAMSLIGSERSGFWAEAW